MKMRFSFGAAFCVVVIALNANMSNAEDGVIAFPSTAAVGLPYAGAVRMGDLVVVGGVLGLSPTTGNVVSGGVLEEGRQAFAHIESMLGLAGATLEDVGICHILLADIDGFAELNSVFREVFPNDPPSRSTAVVPEIPQGAMVEVECTAYAPR